jgi:flavin reductase (DIM6/NTAB) family NADH-FMN oxidoreductase RutF
MPRFKTIKPAALTTKPFDLLDKGWPLLTCGNVKSFNTMTISWGALGTLWNKPVVFIFIRPTRHTFHFAGKSNLFTLSFLPPKYEQLLLYCGTRSGRKVDKVKETGLTPTRGTKGCVYFAEADMVIECRQLYWQDIEPRHFLDRSIHKNYPSSRPSSTKTRLGKKDYHRVYVGEVLRVLKR